MPKKIEKYICSVECPGCKAKLNIVRDRETIEPAVKAEHKDEFRAERVQQQKIG